MLILEPQHHQREYLGPDALDFGWERFFFYPLPLSTAFFVESTIRDK